MEALLIVLLAGFAGLFLFLAKDYGTTAALFPRVVASVSLGFMALDFFWRFSVGAKKTARPQAREQADSTGVSWVSALGLQAGYIGLMYVAGFAAATLIYLIACPWQLRYRNWLATILHAVLLTVAIVYTFHSIFHVRLPKGLLGVPW